MASELFVVGTSQSVAPVCVRERMHVDLGEVYAGLERLRGTPGLLEEAIPVATCGRLEVYGLTKRPRRTIQVLRDMMAERTGLGREELAAHSYLRWGDEAVRHLFRVASGLDSVIYGEAQILGQVREAMAHPRNERVAGSYMKRLFQSALTAGKRVRSETEIGRGAASVAGAALCLLEAEAGALGSRTALVLGAGETGALVASLLRKSGVARLLIANRTLARAEDVAADVSGEAYGLDQVPTLLSQADIVVGAVTGRDDLITADMLRSEGSSGRPRYFLDLAHPRNFPEEVRGVPGVWLMDLTQVFTRVEEALQFRTAQVPRAEAIVDAEVENFSMWVRSRETAPVLRAVREQILAVAQEEAERKARGRTPEEREELLRFARSLARTLLHSPTVAIRDADPSSPEGRWLLRNATSLFGVPPKSDVAAGGAG
ncbi:MAG: glutamyl-tRNA reductase [Longimicrobiales bacterium]